MTRSRQLVECDQDQWDIYKLDPAYDCLIRAPPEVSAITAAAPKPTAEGKQPLGKHGMSSAEPCPEMPPSKKVHLEKDEVADMIVDDGAMPSMRRMPSAAGDRAKKFREETEKNRKERREKAAARSERLAFREDAFFNFAAQPIQPQHTGSPTLDTGPKRKGVFSRLFCYIFAEHQFSRVPLRLPSPTRPRRPRVPISRGGSFAQHRELLADQNLQTHANPVAWGCQTRSRDAATGA